MCFCSISNMQWRQPSDVGMHMHACARARTHTHTHTHTHKPTWWTHSHTARQRWPLAQTLSSNRRRGWTSPLRADVENHEAPPPEFLLCIPGGGWQSPGHHLLPYVSLSRAWPCVMLSELVWFVPRPFLPSVHLAVPWVVLAPWPAGCGKACSLGSPNPSSAWLLG